MTHLHDEAKNVRVVVEHDTTTHVRIKLPGGVGHDAGRKVSLDLAEELIVNDYFFRWKLHGSSMITFHTSQHDPISDKT